MSTKTRRRALAVPFVLTLTALPACVTQDDAHANPPAPPSTATAPDPAVPATTATTTATTTAPASATPPARPPLIATGTQPAIKIRKAPDGSCWQDSTDFKCPPEPATCNPPPPKKVDCPK